MEPHVAALVHLIAIARADGAISPRETALIDRYRRALRVSRRRLQAALEASERSPMTREEIPGSEAERVAALKMMIRVAFADGVFCDRERRRLERVALSLRIEALEYADLLVAVEEEMGHRRRHRAVLLGVAGLAVVLLGALWGGSLYSSRSSGPRAEIPKGPDRGNAALPAPASTDGPFSLKSIHERCAPSVLLIVVWYDLIRGEDRIRRSGAGTGFFVTATGHIATSKHLVRPWLFRPDVVRLIHGEGYHVDPDSVRIAAWPGNTSVRTANGGLNLGEAFHTHADDPTLTVFRLPPDELEHRRERLPDGTSYFGPFHVRSNADLAVLKAEVEHPVIPLRIQPPDVVNEPLDSVLIIGFPAGLRILEANQVVPSPCPGVIRKIEDTIFTNVSVHHGNSGGPGLNGDGFVIGVVTRYVGDPSLSSCIRAEHLLPLLPDPAALLSQALALEERGALGAALEHYDLARRKAGNLPTGIEEEIDRLIAIRDRLVERIRALEETGDARSARRHREKLEACFGPRWIEEADLKPE